MATEHRFHFYPKGCISSIAELKGIYEEAREENRTIPLWAVHQMGYIQKMEIRPDNKWVPFSETIMADRGPEFDEFTIWKEYSLEKSTFYKDKILAGSYNLRSLNDNARGCHRLFANEQFAIAYSEELKNDPVYVQYVKEHHSWCNRHLNNDLGNHDLRDYEDES